MCKLIIDLIDQVNRYRLWQSNHDLKYSKVWSFHCPTGLQIVFSLASVRSHGEPLHVVCRIRSASTERLDVVYLIAWA